MIAIVANLLGTKVGRWVAGGLLFTAIVAYVLWSTFRKGQTSAQTAQKVKQLEALREKVKNDTEIRDMSAAERREHLRKWVRD